MDTAGRTNRRLLNILAVVVLATLDHGADLQHDAYIWQRSWNPSLRNAISNHAAAFHELVVLGGEVTWSKAEPQLTHVSVDYASLTKLKLPVGLALRIGPYSGPFTGGSIHFLSSVAQSLIAEAKANGCTPAEFQLDFDCAESKLDGYRQWVEALRKTIAPLPLTITTLPSWLGQTAFVPLVKATDGYVLQVHSLEKPKSPDARFTLCDPAVVRRAAERAAKIDVPFRIALPTYGYLLAFDHTGKFIGLSAEGPAKSWPRDAQIREVHSNPIDLTQLLKEWSGTNSVVSTAKNFRGIIWYRFPVPEDTFNLRWKTLDAMMRLRSPQLSLRAEPRRVEAGLVEINLVNNGEIDCSSRLAIEVRWSHEGGIRLVAGDGLRDFELVDAPPSAVRFLTKAKICRLPAGESQVIGWLRLSADREVQIELKQDP